MDKMSDDSLRSHGEGGRGYMPAITKARWVRRYRLGSYRAVVGTDCESMGSIHYTHVMYVFQELEEHPSLAVTSEYSDDFGEDGSRFLCWFFDGKHFNAGSSTEWADLDTFIQKALEVVVKTLGISEAPQELLP